MDCDDCFEKLYAYLDRELDGGDLEAVKRHIAGCAPCDDHFVFERRFLEQVRDLCTSDHAPADLRERVVVRLRAT